MPKLIIASSLLLFWAFYEMSGGADFEPRERIAETQAPFTPTPAVDMVETTTLAPVVPAVVAPVAVQTSTVSSYEFVSEPVIIRAAAPAVPDVVAVVEEAHPIPDKDLRIVAGDRVNLRAGPGTQHLVLATLPRGTEAAVIDVNDDGWVKISLTDADQVGWMAASLLTAP